MTTSPSVHNPDVVLLRAVAQRLPAEDRRAGNIVVILCEIDGTEPLVNVIAECPMQPTPEQCRIFLEPFAMAIADPDGARPPMGIGVIWHRERNDRAADRELLAALETVACTHGVDILGFAARTPSGPLHFPGLE